MGILTAMGLVSIKTSALRQKKLQEKFDENTKRRVDEMGNLKYHLRGYSDRNKTLREKLYKANNWQIHVEILDIDLNSSNVSQLLESKLSKKVDKPFTFIKIEEFTQIAQEGKIKVHSNGDKEDTCYLYFSYTIINSKII